MTNELAVRNETRLAGLAAFAQDNDTVMLAGDRSTSKRDSGSVAKRNLIRPATASSSIIRKPTPAGRDGASASQSISGSFAA
jgi:hypothetical protein